MPLRAITWLVSFALHAALAWHFVRNYDVSAYAAGAGAEEFIVEQGIAVEGVATLGHDAENVEAIEEEPVEMSEARPEIKEVEASEVVEENKVITSDSGPEQEALPEEIKEVEQQQQVATVAQETVVPQEQKVAAGETREGGDSSALRAYEGKLHEHLMRKAVRPRTGKRVGRVVVRFTIDPSGEVLSREVTESSGYKGIDDAALASIDRASPFPPIPSEIAAGPLVRTVPFRYQVQ